MHTKCSRVAVVCTALLLTSLAGAFGSSAGEFSQERAYEHLRNLAGTIGPRPLGSPGERAALEYFARQVAEFGGKVEWQPVSGKAAPEGKDALNTASFNVIGRFEGSSPRQIIIGAHIDSSTPEIAGADDDGSGVAAVLEAARVLTAKPHDATLLFVAFCGEEAGLVGSKYFVEHCPLENVALMLQLDMTSDEAPLMLWIDSRNGQSPAWLVSASLEIYRGLGYRDLEYPTIFQSLNSSLGGAGSDHEPFLAKGIPAIAFVSDIRHPIHTPYDTLEYFKPDGLARSGRLIVGLVDRFDRGQPAEKTGRYMLVLAGGRPFFIQQAWLAAFAVLSLIAALAALVRLYRPPGRAGRPDEDRTVKKSWPKLLIVHFVMLVVTFASFRITGQIRGVRLPWVIQPGAYVLYAFLFFILGVWLSLQILRKWRLRRNAFFYSIRASVYLAVLILVFGFAAGPRLAFYPAAGLLLVSLACLARPAWLKAALWLMSPVLMFRLLVLPEYHEFLYRTIGLSGLGAARTGLAFAALNLAVILFTVLWSQPFLLGFAAVYRSSGTDLFRLLRFRRPLAVVPLAVLMAVGAVWLARQPGYERPWEQEVRVIQKFDAATNRTSVEFSSGDYLRGLRAEIGGRVEDIMAKTCYRALDFPLEMNWLRAAVRPQVTGSAGVKLARVALELAFDRQPYAVTLRLRSNRPLRVETSNVHYRRRKNGAAVSWQYFPDSILRPEFELRLDAEATLDAEIRAVFLETPLPVVCRGKNMHFVRRSEIVRQIEILKP